MGWAGPLWQERNIISEGCVVDLVNKKANEGGGLVLGIRLELGVKLDDECRGDCREQTSLCPDSTRVRGYENSQRLGLCSNPHYVS